jgi:hypothetical protein
VSTDDQMSIEDRVRTATRAGASLIRDVRPLGAPAPVRLRRRPERSPRRWVNWGVPLGAAAAVAAIALTLVAVRQPAAPAPAASASGPAAPATIPRYYATTPYDAHTQLNGPLIVGDDLTGKVIDTVSPPPGLEFLSVQGTSDDRTFVVEAAASTPPYGAPPYTWYLLRIAPGSAHPYQLTKLPVKLPDTRTFSPPYALSPDGRELAVEWMPGKAEARPDNTRLAIYSVSTGAQLRAWTAPTTQITSEFTQHLLSWPNGGRQLVFSATAASGHGTQLRALDLTGAGTNLMADSHPLLPPYGSGPSACGSLQVTPDGGTAVCATRTGLADGGGCATGPLQFIAFPVPNQAGRVLYQYRGCKSDESFTVWTDASARTIIGGVNAVNQGGSVTYKIGVIAGGRFRPLNIAKSVPPGQYPDLAF